MFKSFGNSKINQTDLHLCVAGYNPPVMPGFRFFTRARAVGWPATYIPVLSPRSHFRAFPSAPGFPSIFLSLIFPCIFPSHRIETKSQHGDSLRGYADLESCNETASQSIMSRARRPALPAAETPPLPVLLTTYISPSCLLLTSCNLHLLRAPHGFTRMRTAAVRVQYPPGWTPLPCQPRLLRTRLPRPTPGLPPCAACATTRWRATCR